MSTFFWLIVITYTTYGATSVSSLPYPTEAECNSAAAQLTKDFNKLDFIKTKCLRGYAR